MKQTQLPFFLEQEAETTSIEFKTSSEGRLPKDIWQVISAFSNTDGGKIVFGITPDGSRIHLDRNEIDKLQLDITSLCTEAFNTIVVPEIQYNDDILIAYIPPLTAQLRPLYLKRKGVNNGSYIRVGSSNILANEETLRRFAIAARGGAETILYNDTNYQDLFDLGLVSEYIKLLNSRKGNIYQNFSAEEVLIKLKAINKNKNVTLFGLLAFGKDTIPQEIIAPTVSVSLTVYPGLTKVNEDDLEETYIDNKEFLGNVTEQFDKTFRYIKTTLPVRGAIDSSGKRRDYLVIPEVALREALANAIAHRDYSTNSSSIQIDIFSDRVEIINPGTSLVPIDQLDVAPSSARNPLLMSYLKDHGITDQKARGIRTIKISLKKAGLLEPKFENIGHSFRIILFASAFISNIDKRWLSQFTAFNLNERQLNALVHAKNNSDGISNSEYRHANSMNNVRDDKKANRELRGLVELDILYIAGENRARRYIINDKYT